MSRLRGVTRGYLLRLTLGDRAEAEDHLQETFLRAWRWLQEHPVDLASERTAREAANVLGVPEGTVKSRAHYALRAPRAAAIAGERRRPGRTLPAVTRQHH